MKLENKKILVTGGNSGIGLATSKALIAKGCNVTILGRDENKLLEATKHLGSRKVEHLVCDISDIDAIENIKPDIVQRDFDGIINAAGIIEYGLLENHTPKMINDVISTNLTGLICLTSYITPRLKDINDGAIVNISSTSGLYRRGNETVYVASKWGVQGFTEGLQVELENTNIKVIGIYPGGVDTPLFEKSSSQIQPAGEFMSPEQVAEIIVFAISQPSIVKLDKLVINRNKSG